MHYSGGRERQKGERLQSEIERMEDVGRKHYIHTMAANFKKHCCENDAVAYENDAVTYEKKKNMRPLKGCFCKYFHPQ